MNKSHIVDLTAKNLMHESGQAKINIAKQNGSWYALDEVEELTIPLDLGKSFNDSPIAFANYNNFSPSYKKSYLYWLNQAKKEQTRATRISEIISLCFNNKKSRN